MEEEVEEEVVGVHSFYFPPCSYYFSCLWGSVKLVMAVDCDQRGKPWRE